MRLAHMLSEVAGLLGRMDLKNAGTALRMHGKTFQVLANITRDVSWQARDRNGKYIVNHEGDKHDQPN